MDILEKFVHKDFIKQELAFSEFYRYLDRYRSAGTEVLSGQQRDDIKRNESVELNNTIWMYWNQGLENAPQLVQKCYESVCRNKQQDFKIVLLSDRILNEYINLPDYIWDKYERGYIITAHLADIIRLELLCTYGGCWIDATVFCSDIIPRYMVQGDMFVFKFPSVVTDPVLKMSNWWIFSNQSNRLIHQTRQMLYEYWKQETDARNYFLFHIMMSKLIDEDKDCKKIYQNIPYVNSGNAFVLEEKLGTEYNAEEWKIFKSISCVHKLTHKNKYLQGDIYNYYTALLTDGL